MTQTLNFVQIETKTGIKEFELIHGDITALPFKVDLLCISAFRNDYAPTHSSVVGHLFRKGINVERLSHQPYLDFKDSLGVWVSSAVPNDIFNQLVCVEIIGRNRSLQHVIKNLFAVISALEIQGQKNTTLALPLLGSGNQGIDTGLVMPTLIETSLDFLKYSRHLKKIYFVVIDKLLADLFNSEMNTALGRAKIKSPKGELAELLKKDLNTQIDLLLDHHEQEETFQDLKRVVNSDFRPFEFGAATRKAVEKIIDLLHPASKKQSDMMKKIESLHMIGISSWIGSYMHTIRVFGNEAVHNKDSQNRKPEFVDEKDLEIGMYCMSKILEFFNDHSRKK